MSGSKHVWEQGRYKGTCRACNSVGELNVMLSAKISEQAADLALLRDAAQTALKKHSKLVVNGVLGYTAYESEELENLAKALEEDDEH